MSENRTNTIVKVPFSKCTVKLFYDLFVRFLQQGADGWQLMRDREWPYGAILKVPNWKDGEYGYAGLMYHEVRPNNYRKWLFQHDVMRNQFVYNHNGLNLNKDAIVEIGKNNGRVRNAYFYTTNTRTRNPQHNTFRLDTNFSPNFAMLNMGGISVIPDDVVIGSTILPAPHDQKYVMVPLGCGADAHKKGDKIRLIFGDSSYTSHTLFKDPEVTDEGIKVYIRPRNKRLVPDNTNFCLTGTKGVDKGSDTFLLTNVNGTIKAGVRFVLDGHKYEVLQNATADADTKLVRVHVKPALVKKTARGTRISEIPYPEYFDCSTNNVQYTGPDYQITQAEIFGNKADVIFGGMFKQYESEFDWNELMSGTDRPGMHARHLRFSHGSPYNWRSFMPIYPGAGWPAIGYAPDFFTKHVIDKEKDYATLFFTRTKHNATMIINFREYWDMLEIGFFEPFASNHEYAFPAMVISSNSGMRPTCTKETDRPGIPYAYQTYMYDYTEANQSFGHAMPNYAAADVVLNDPASGTNIGFPNSPSSQVQAIVPAGYWQGFASYYINTEYYYIYNYGYWYAGDKEPVPKENGGVISCIWPSGTAPTQTINSINVARKKDYDYDWTLDNLDDIHAQAEKEYHNITPVFLAYTDSSKNATGGTTSIINNMLGLVPGLYWCSQPVTRYGIYYKAELVPADETGKHLYLVLPNCWEGRKYHIQNFFYELLKTRSITQDKLEPFQVSEIKRLEELSKKMNTVLDLGINVEEGEFSPNGNPDSWYADISGADISGGGDEGGSETGWVDIVDWDETNSNVARGMNPFDSQGYDATKPYVCQRYLYSGDKQIDLGRNYYGYYSLLYDLSKISKIRITYGRVQVDYNNPSASYIEPVDAYSEFNVADIDNSEHESIAVTYGSPCSIFPIIADEDVLPLLAIKEIWVSTDEMYPQRQGWEGIEKIIYLQVPNIYMVIDTVMGLLK